MCGRDTVAGRVHSPLRSALLHQGRVHSRMYRALLREYPQMMLLSLSLVLVRRAASFSESLHRWMLAFSLLNNAAWTSPQSPITLIWETQASGVERATVL